MKVAAVHFQAVFAKIEENEKRAEEYIKEAKDNGAKMIVFPEFFTTGFVTSNELVLEIAKGIDTSGKMKEWAIEYEMYICGSFLYYDGTKVVNKYCIACPNGETFFHAKDVPTVLEGMYYEAGDQEFIAHSTENEIGMCMCWEMMRSDTIRKMQEKVNYVVAGSCWWELFDEDLPEQMRQLKDFSAKEAKIAPVRLAKLLHVPVIHASHSAIYEGANPLNPSKPVARKILGATQIVDENGSVLACLDDTKEPGIIYANISTKVQSKIEKPIEGYWISLPEEFTLYWNQVNAKCHEYYEKVTLPLCKKMHS